MCRVNVWKKGFFIVALIMVITVAPLQQAQAAFPIIELLKFATKKVIRAIDLQIQKQQNKVIWLQNAQKTLENALSKLKLQEISDWVEKHRKLYDDYFQELRKVKDILYTYRKVREVIHRQLQLVEEYSLAWNLLRQDKNFTAEELAQMYRVYTAIIEESLKNLDQLFLVVNSFETQMTDGKRLELIAVASRNMEQNLVELRHFNRKNFRLSLSRTTNEKEAAALKKIYGLNE